MNSEVGVLYNKPISEKGLRDTALDTFKRLSGERREPVEDRTFFEEMEKTTKFTREQAGEKSSRTCQSRVSSSRSEPTFSRRHELTLVSRHEEFREEAAESS